MATGAGAVLDPGRILARASGENFPVASRVLPRDLRSPLMAIYGFARMVDDIGDEAPADRVALLDRVSSELDGIYTGTDRRRLHPLMGRLADTVRALSLPRDPFERLIEANRRDQSVTRYEAFDDLLAYCELSANPVGHLVLAVLGAATPRRLEWSDAICTGLQLAEHWQDVGEDLRQGRVYLPAEDLRRFGVAVEEIGQGRPTPSFRRLMAFEGEGARALLDRGLPLAADLGGRFGFAVAAYVAGGRAALQAIAAANYDVLSSTPRASRVRRASALVGTLVEARRRGSHP
jgi:squalene synthase HpnC